MANEVVLAGIDREHLESALELLAGGKDRASFGTDFWSEDARERIESWPTNIPIYIYEVTRGTSDPVNAATWVGTFVEYVPREEFRVRELDWTRPESARGRRDPDLPTEEQEPDWNGYLLVSDLHRIENPKQWVPLAHFRVRNRPFAGSVVRHPLLAAYVPRRNGET